MDKRFSASSFNFDRLVIASHNRGKLREFELLFSPFGVSCICFGDLHQGSAVEDGLTFALNAHKKSVFVAEHTDLPILADDSGLSIDGLDGKPGIHSARYAKSGFEDAMERILSDLKAKNLSTPLERAAKFTCALSFIAGKKDRFLKETIEPKIFIGELKGHISDKIFVGGGFGYDPIFIPASQKEALSKLHIYEKQALSHRRKAFDKLLSYLKKDHVR